MRNKLADEIAAANARERIKARLKELEKTDPAIEFRFSLPDPWLNAIVPSIAFLLSTLTLPFFKKLWQKYLR